MNILDPNQAGNTVPQRMISKVHLGGLAANSNWPGTCEEKTGNKVNAGPGACANQPTWSFTRLPHRRQRDGSGEQQVQMPDTIGQGRTSGERLLLAREADVVVAVKG